MNAELFLENFGHLADAPGGVQKLREMVIDLAAQGKLVSQNFDELPATEMIIRNRLRHRDAWEAQEREKMTRSGKNVNNDKLKTRYPEPEPIDVSCLPTLPEMWGWERIELLGCDPLSPVQTGPFGSQLLKDEFVDSGVPVVAVGNLTGTGFKTDKLYQITTEKAEQLDRYTVNSGDLLFARTGSVGRACIAPEFVSNWRMTGHILRVRLNDEVVNPHLVVEFLWAARCVRNQVVGSIRGMTRPGYNTKLLESIVLPIPPREEQDRILNKVRELMALCDELAARQEERRAVHVRLNDAALDRLTSAENDTDFNTAWTRLRTNFNRLYSLPQNVNALRQTILQLAVQGKLVPQDPNDEPASELIKKIMDEKEQLESQKKIRRSKLQPLRDEIQLNHALPCGWTWVTLDDVSDIGTGTTPAKTKQEYYQGGTIPWITSAATNHEFIEAPQFYITEQAFRECNLRLYPAGSLAIALYGQGKTRGQVGQLMFDSTSNQASAVVSFFGTGEGIRDFVRLFFKKQYQELRALAAGGAQPNLSGGIIRHTRIPLPPLAEQQRIMTRVTQLTSLCDELETKLTQQQTDADRLTEAMVAAILNGDAA